jgi:hypothetical protein
VRYPLGQESALVLQIANVVSTVLGTLIRYLSYRRWVFPSHRRVNGEVAAASSPDARTETMAAPNPGSAPGRFLD